MILEFDSIDFIENLGFIGFYTIDEISSTPSLVPDEMGIYLILNTNINKPEFLHIGSGGHFKGRNPNVSLSVLEENWVEHTLILYIGKAGGLNSLATLQSRLKQYMRFGKGKPVGHWGGRHIWQIREADKLIVCWKPLPDPRESERRLIEDFVLQYGRLPFANLVG
jgi:hypothetical protein